MKQKQLKQNFSTTTGRKLYLTNHNQKIKRFFKHNICFVLIHPT